MRQTKMKRNTLVFIGLLLLAGITHLLTKTDYTQIDASMNSIGIMIYLGLLLFWIESVRTRLLTSKIRTGIIWTGWLMLSYLLIRTIKYDYVNTPLGGRYAAYAYWTPQMLIPTLFLMTCIRIRRGGEGKGRWNEAWLLIPACLLSLMALTNDLHKLVYCPTVPLSSFDIATGTFSYGPGFWLLNAWMILAFLAGLVLLFRETGKRYPRVIRTLAALVLAWVGLILLNLLVFERGFARFKMFGNPEIHIFCMLGLMEVCIRSRLIPYNENYSGFFSRLRFPAFITDLRMEPVYRAAEVPEAEWNSLQAALESPLALTQDRKLTGKAVRGGCAFWVTDESAVHQAQERLREANELIEQENDLILAEAEQRRQEAYLQSRHRIYHEIAQEIYPCQKRISRLLEGAEPGTEEFRDRIARVSILNTYVKRKTNLLLLASEQDRISTSELFLALRESANYLTLAGLHTVAAEQDERLYPADLILALYDGFEALAEQLLGQASSMMVSWKQDGLCLAAQTDAELHSEGLALPVRFRRFENTLYMDLLTPKGGGES